MSWFFAWGYDPFMRRSEEACLRAWRAELLGDLRGDVLEIGAGTGANVPFYRHVERLVLTDPDPDMLGRLRPRLDASGRSAEVIVADADALPFPDATFDAVVATLVLCSVGDPTLTLGEIKRVLRPGGAFVFMEHVAAEEASSRHGWQRRINPLWRRFAGNCHLTRRTDEAIAAAGFRFETITRDSMRKALPILRPTIRGVARLEAH